MSPGLPGDGGEDKSHKRHLWQVTGGLGPTEQAESLVDKQLDAAGHKICNNEILEYSVKPVSVIVLQKSTSIQLQPWPRKSKKKRKKKSTRKFGKPLALDIMQY